MTTSVASPVVARRLVRTGRAPLTRLLSTAITAIGLLAVSHGSARAQGTPERAPRWEFRMVSGTLVPTGAQRQSLERGGLSAAQLSRVVRPSLALTASLTWARSRDLASAGDPRLDAFGYDLGAEARGPRWSRGSSVAFRHFVVAGVGMRSYSHRHLALETTHRLAAYAGAGGELEVGRVGFRLEARDYVTRFEPLADRRSADPRNDVVLMAGLRLVPR